MQKALSEASVMEDSVPALEPLVMQRMEETFTFDDSVVIAAFQVYKHKRSAEFTGSKLIKALGNKVSLTSLLCMADL
jgi:hypothetical protein